MHMRSIYFTISTACAHWCFSLNSFVNIALSPYPTSSLVEDFLRTNPCECCAIPPIRKKESLFHLDFPPNSCSAYEVQTQPHLATQTCPKLLPFLHNSPKKQINTPFRTNYIAKALHGTGVSNLQ
ncbi:uncharacterized protein LY89DRAFT_58931 [Mollisia scopiformis]|uniref:Uncharacterized protein n=1 Tax=Mollisia scopiformis TaxID=149040 RepID=A0A194XBY3_MOLSC|nr:uncharacterized protein LY89DRAFT_58931 [Mollisia scopiformis]KUJ17674.1 hypothetical protein LY89DRAFT_58931 [Mollisia scopiformis]